MQIISLWSGPRNVSTALMYSFAQRPDTKVIDEPLYGHYLKVSARDHPGRDEVLRAMEQDGDAITRRLLDMDFRPASILFLKHMAHHLRGMDLSFLEETRNAFLIRDPEDMLPSLTVQLPDARLADTGLKRQWELFSRLQNLGQTPVVIDSRELLLDPTGVLTSICEWLGVDFIPAMLHWPAGPIAEDGIWAKYWYASVHKSTGFAAYVAKDHFPARLEPLLEECKPYFDRLYAQAIKARPTRNLPS